MQVTWESVGIAVGVFGGPTLLLALFAKGFFVEYVAPRIKLEIQAYHKSSDFTDAEKTAVKKTIEEETRRSDGVIATEIEKHVTKVATEHNNRLERALVDINRSLADNTRTTKDLAERHDSWGRELSEVKGGIDVLLRLNGAKPEPD